MIPKALTILGYRKFINEFFKKFPQHLQLKTWSPKPFTALIHAFHEDFIQAVIDNRDGADLPLKLGNIKIVAYKSNRRYPNFKNHLHTGAPITGFVNNHTEGLNCKLLFDNKPAKYKLKDKRIWAFVPEVSFKKKISKSFVDNYNKYIYSPNTTKVRFAVRDMNLKDVNDKKIKEFLITHNEFYLN